MGFELEPLLEMSLLFKLREKQGQLDKARDSSCRFLHKLSNACFVDERFLSGEVKVGTETEKKEIIKKFLILAHRMSH